MASDSILSTTPISPSSSRRRRRKSIARLFGAFTVPANEAQRAARLRDGCTIPLNLDYVRPDCLLPADVASLYVETDNLHEAGPQLPSVAIISKATIYVRLNYVRIAVCESQSIEIEIGIFDQCSERFVADNVILSSKNNTLSDWVGFLEVDVTPSCMIVLRIYAIGALVKDCSSIRDCRRQIGFSSFPLSCLISEAPLTQHELPVSRPKNDRQFAKLLTSSSAINRYRRSMAFRLRLQAANVIPLGTPYRALLSRSANTHPESSLIRFDLISGEFKNAFKSSQMNICIEASVIVRATTKELICLRRGSEQLRSLYSSGIVYHCNTPEFRETFTISIDAIRREVEDAHISLLLRALHVARCGTVTTVGYITLMIFDRESGRIATTNNQAVSVQLLDIADNRKTKNRLYFKSTIVSKHDTDDDILALILSGKALYTDLKLAHARIQNSSNIDVLLQKKLMEHYIAKGSCRQDATLNAAWSLCCLLRKRLLNKGGFFFEPINADILLTNIILCLRFNSVDLVQLSLEVFGDPSSIIVTDIAKCFASYLVNEADSSRVKLTGTTLVLLFKLLTNLMPPDQLRAAFDRLVLRTQHLDDIKYIRAKLGESSELDQKIDREDLITLAIRYALTSDEACCCFAKPLSALLQTKLCEDDIENLLLLLHRLYNMFRVPHMSKTLMGLQILTIQIVRTLHSSPVIIPSHEVELHLEYVSRTANNTAFEPSHIVLRIMELHAATLILDMIPAAHDTDLTVPKALLMLLNGKDMQLYGLRKRRSAYIYLHINKWLQPWMLNILVRHSAVSPDVITMELLLRLMIRENLLSDEMRALLVKWKSGIKDGMYKLALCNEAFLIVKERWLYSNAIKFFKQVAGSWESQSFEICFTHLSEANLASFEGNVHRKIDALVSALSAVRHVDEALHIRLYIIDELICLYDSMQLTGPELAQCYLERGETQRSTDPGRLNDFRKALRLATDCFEWEKAAMICERIIYGCTGLDRNLSFVPYFRKTRADLLRRIQTEDRVMPQYSRVAFNASSSHHISERGREFVYRLRTGESVLEFTDRLRMQYPYAEVKNSYLDPENMENGPVITIQRVEVSNNVQSEENNSDAESDSLSLPIRFRHFVMHSDANAFSFARLEIIPSNAGDETRPDIDISYQWYEIHCITVTNKFPFLSWRQLIVNHTKYWQSPIQTAILAVRQGTQKLQREMEKIIFAAKQKDGNIDVSQLSLVLSGIIDAPVNGGITVYRSCFLPDSERYSNEQEELQNAIKNQSCVLKKGLDLFKDSISVALLPLYTHLENQWQKTFPNS